MVCDGDKQHHASEHHHYRNCSAQLDSAQEHHSVGQTHGCLAEVY